LGKRDPVKGLFRKSVATMAKGLRIAEPPTD